MIMLRPKLTISHVLRARNFSSCSFCARPFDHSESKRGQLDIDSLLKNDWNLSSKRTEHSKPSEFNHFANKFNRGERKPNPERFERRTRSDYNTSRPQRKVLRFKFSGSEQAQLAVKSIIAEVYESSPQYRVNFVDPESNKLERKHLADIINNTDFKDHGIQVVISKGLPLIKMTSSKDMLKLFSEKLAIEKERELLEKGSVKVQYAIQQRERAKQKKSATKIMTFAWNISIGDLNNQKRTEINKKLDKGENFLIYIGDKRTLSSAKKSVDKGDGLINKISKDEEFEEQNFDPLTLEEDRFEIEMRRRQLVVDNMKTILEECDATFEINGDLESRVVIRCEVKPNRISNKKEQEEQQLSAKELKKQRKILKQKEAEEKRKQKTTNETDIDSLYLFKIEE